MAPPSPELGHQPKAPDKTPASGISSSNAKKNQNDNFPNHMAATNSAAGANCSSMTTSTATTSNSSSSTAVPASNSANEKSSKNLGHWKDNELKDLLDEAYSYKSPKDRENKSETFRQLLEKVEREKDNHFPAITETRYQRGSNSHKHGGSLQDLAEATTHDILDSDYSYGKNNRRHHHNSRTKKSVSSRQREGGSLPSDVNVSNCNLSIYEPSFLNEVINKEQNEFAFSSTSCASGTSGTSSVQLSNCGQDSASSSESKDDSNTCDLTNETGDAAPEDGSQTKILIQDKQNSMDIDVGVEVHTTMNLQATLEISYPESKHNNWVDQSISFPSLERGKATLDASCALPFDDSSKSCQSVLGEKSEKPKPALFQTSKVITPPAVDENGNAIVSKKKKKFQSDRNTTTLNIQSVEGYRGRDTIASLVKFIESKETEPIELAKKADKVLPVATKKKEKKKEKDIKKDMHKVKKSTSLEELRSCTKLDEDDKLESGVTMRAKGKKCSIALMGVSHDGKENVKQHSKRGERRSWGTEELTYLGENNAIEEVREKNKEKEKSKKSKELIEKQEKFENIERIEQKKCERSTSVLSMESAQSETAEFHVVTKKKRSKKRQNFEENRPVCKMRSFSSRTGSSGHKKYQSISSFSNDRDAYLAAHNSHDSRRKSTSSVPPSEKSDSSDLDSVHSLPIESTSNRHNSSNSSQMQHQSYADIARTVNLNKQYAISSPPIDKWPAVSSNTTTPNATEVPILSSSYSSLNTTRPVNIKSKSLIKDFPDLVTDRANSNHEGASSSSSSSSTSTIIKHISYSQSLGDDNHTNDLIRPNAKSPPAVVSSSATKLTNVIKSNDITKQTLQKSKSVENESYYNIDQYPALEKPVKRHATQNPSTDLKLTHNPNAPSTASYSTHSFNITKQQRSPPSSIHQQQQLPLASIGSVSAITTSSNNIILTLNDKSKMFVNNLDMNTNIAATSSSNISIVNSNVILNNGKKSKGNTKAIETPTAIVELNNVKNTKQKTNPNPAVSSDVITAGDLQSNNVGIHSRKPKSESLQMIVGNPISRKAKKDKNQNSTNASNSNAIFESQQASVSLSRNASRPAVIILNDSSDSTMCISNDFTFGDFNEDEIRLFENNHLDDSGNLNVIGQDVCSSSSTTSDAAPDEIHLSPHSDLGYSSSHNRSMFSESIDGNNSVLPKKILANSEYESNFTATNLTLRPNTLTDCKQLLNKTSSAAASLFPHDSAIIIAAQSCLVPQISQKPSSINTKVLSSNNTTLINNQTRDNKYNEIINCDINVTGNNNIVNSVNVNNNNNNNISSNAILSANTSTVVSRATNMKPSTLDKFETDLVVDGEENSRSHLITSRSVDGTVDIVKNTGTIQKSSCDNNITKKFSKKTINIRFIAPPITQEINLTNYEKIVDFVALAWEDILHGVNGETEFYDGQ